MACRCSEIRRCSSDMTQIMVAICRAKNTLPHVQSLENQLQALADNSPSAYTTESSGEISAAINKLDDDIPPALESLIAALEAKYDEMGDLKNRLQSEDDHHHEAERMASASDE